MDLIYANANKEDIGILTYYNLDMAYGSSENNFELELNLSEHCLDYGYYIYAENTEYGGIVDTIIVDNGNKTVKYQGRTWHGILSKSVIIPDGDYYTVTGDANQVIADIIERQGLSDIFSVSDEESGLQVNYAFRYNDVYTGILDMLKSVQGKLIMSWQDGKVNLSCQLAIDFTNNDDWDSSQLEFQISQNNRPVNHLICLGQGNMSDRAVIHLFTDDDGNIQPYAIKDEPLEDSDYIIDDSNIQLTGIDEVAETYDYSSAEILTNYIPLEEQPADWISNHTAYFNKNEDGDFKSLEVTQQDKYTLLTSKPADWDSNFARYYGIDGGEYKSLESITATLYNILLESPSDWSTNYSNYYIKDGNSYKSIEAVTNYRYKLLTKQPNDWQKNYSNYYTFDGRKYNSASGDSKTVYYVQLGKPSGWDNNYKSAYWKAPVYAIKASNNARGYETYIKGSEWMTADKIYVIDKAKIKEWKKANNTQRKKININKQVDYVSEYKKIPKWRKDTYYNQGSITITPPFRKNYYYSQSTYLTAPRYAPATYYQKVVATTAPTFETNKYYSKAVVNVYNTFASNLYYRQAQDRYRNLVDGGIERLTEAYAERNTVAVDLEETQLYDINDIVGARENVTGISVKQYIIKKIIKIQNGNITINYTIGKE